MGGTEELIDRCVSYRNDVHDFIYKMTYDARLAEDLTQETLMRAIAGAGGFKGRSELKTWLFAIAKNQVYGSVRDRKKDVRKLATLRAAENAAPVQAEMYDYERDFYVEQIKNGCLYALLMCLPFNQRCAFILRTLNDLPFKTVAEVLGKSENATRILIARAKATIREFLCANCEHIEESPQCRCLNMLNFSMRNALVRKIDATPLVKTAKNELGKLRDEIELLKTLPYAELKTALRVDPQYARLFSKK